MTIIIESPDLKHAYPIPNFSDIRDILIVFTPDRPQKQIGWMVRDGRKEVSEPLSQTSSREVIIYHVSI
jgi:hypothetical protein